VLKKIKGFLVEEDGLGTVELVLLIAVLVGLALIFKTAIADFVRTALAKIKGNDIDPKSI